MWVKKETKRMPQSILEIKQKTMQKPFKRNLQKANDIKSFRKFCSNQTLKFETIYIQNIFINK